MATIDWPTTLQGFYPSRMTWGASTPKTSWASPYSGQVQSISHAGDRLRCVIDLPPLKDPAAAAVREAFFMGAYSSGDWLRVPHFLRSVPRGTLRGLPKVNANTAAGARTLVLKDAGANRLLQPTNFDPSGPAPWSTVGALTVTTNTGNDPFGNLTADTLTDSDAVNGAALVQSVAIPAGVLDYTASVYTPKTSFGPSTFCALGLVLTGGSSTQTGLATVNTDLGTSTTVIGVAIESVGTWWRISYTLRNTTGATSARIEIYPIADLDSATGSRVFACARLEQSSAASDFEAGNTLLGGDLLQVGNQMLTVGYAGAASDEGTGLMTVPLALPLRVAVTADAAVIWDRPTATFQLQGVESMVEYGPRGVQQGLQVTLSEVFA